MVASIQMPPVTSAPLKVNTWRRGSKCENNSHSDHCLWHSHLCVTPSQRYSVWPVKYGRSHPALCYCAPQLQFAFFACLVKMDTGPLYILPLPPGTPSSFVNRSFCRRRRFLPPGSSGPTGRFLKHRWFLQPIPAIGPASPAPGSWRADGFWVSLARRSPGSAVPRTFEGRVLASSRGHISAKFCKYNAVSMSLTFSESRSPPNNRRGSQPWGGVCSLSDLSPRSTSSPVFFRVLLTY